MASSVWAQLPLIRAEKEIKCARVHVCVLPVHLHLCVHAYVSVYVCACVQVAPITLRKPV